MPESDFPMFQTLLSVATGLLVLLLALGWRISRRLTRIEHLLENISSRPDEEIPQPSADETSPGGAFETFLSEDPARRLLPKSEQFAAYRKWRQEKGMNWSVS
jgi:HAMP domain-containing protein